jgi:hypothetical protein
VTADGVMLPDDVRALVESVRKLMLYENDLPSQVVAALLDAYRERDGALRLRDLAMAAAGSNRERGEAAEREAAQLREALEEITRWDVPSAMRRTAHRALAASREVDRG